MAITSCSSRSQPPHTLPFASRIRSTSESDHTRRNSANTQRWSAASGPSCPGHPSEEGISLPDATSDQVIELLDYPNYFQLMKQPLPDNRPAILDRMLREALIAEAGSDRYHITNIGAMLFARNLSDFRGLSRKALRVIIYRGENRVDTLKEQPGGKGYAVGFEGAIRYINDQLPQNEQIGEAFRKTVRMYPELAVRELVANALVHQDFTITGAGPTAEIFSDRMEITNPGRPLIDPLRFIDEPPRSRNEALASVMRRATSARSEAVASTRSLQ